MEVYSPELVTAQQEYLIAWRGVEAVKDGAAPKSGAGLQQMTASALQRLRNWDISETEIERLQKEGAARQTLLLRSPPRKRHRDRAKAALKGMRFMPGEALYRVADLSSLWLSAPRYSSRYFALVRIGQNARVTVNAFPGKAFTGKVTFIYPTLHAANAHGQGARRAPRTRAVSFKPEMYARSIWRSAAGRPCSHGARLGGDRHRHSTAGAGAARRDASIRARSSSACAATATSRSRSGVRDGDLVVVAANFLIDSESNLKAALNGFGAPAAAPGKPAAGPVHRAEGTVDAIDAGAGSITMTHDPIASLKWPAMTMDFQVANRSLLDSAAARTALR